LAVFWAAYRTVPAPYYQNRDDALITFSHARNLADYGIVGVNPSGGRVEGFSTPVQFALFYAAYKAAKIPYALFTLGQTFFCAFLLGFFFIKFFKSTTFRIDPFPISGDPVRARSELPRMARLWNENLLVHVLSSSPSMPS
jgi:hypothetical protein